MVAAEAICTKLLFVKCITGVSSQHYTLFEAEMSTETLVTLSHRVPKSYEEMFASISRKWNMKQEEILKEWIEENYKTAFRK